MSNLVPCVRGFLYILLVDDPNLTLFTWLYDFLSTLWFSLELLPAFTLPNMCELFITDWLCSLNPNLMFSLDFYLLFLSLLSFDLFLFISKLMFSLFYYFYFESLFEGLRFSLCCVISVDPAYDVFVKKLSINVSAVEFYFRFVGCIRELSKFSSPKLYLLTPPYLRNFFMAR